MEELPKLQSSTWEVVASSFLDLLGLHHFHHLLEVDGVERDCLGHPDALDGAAALQNLLPELLPGIGQLPEALVVLEVRVQEEAHGERHVLLVRLVDRPWPCL